MVDDDAALSDAERMRSLLRRYAAGVAYVAVRKPNGDEDIGAAFHVGDGVFVTARQVVEGNTILTVATTAQYRHRECMEEAATHAPYVPSVGRVVRGPLCHSDPGVDVAALVVEGISAPVLQLGAHLEVWKNDDLLLSPGLVLGYPPIPMTNEPVLVVARAEVNAIVRRRDARFPHFVLSAMPRGGFSGGPVISMKPEFMEEVRLSEEAVVLGVVTSGLVRDQATAELGFFAVLSVDPIFECLAQHDILPFRQKPWGNAFEPWKER